MKCTDVAAILDEHAQQRLTAAERCALDEHLVACEPCAHAWRAQTTLLALPLPATPADLVARALRALDARAPRRARSRAVVIGVALAAGAALAAVTAVRLFEGAADRPAAISDASGARDSVPPQTASPDATAPAAVASAPDGRPVSVEDVQSDYVMIMIHAPPEYPRDALARKLDGDVTVEYTIDRRGSVKDVRAVRSSDPQFEAPAIAAVSQWKYLPRVTGGKRVEVNGVQTVIRFTMSMPPPAQPPAKSGETARKFQSIKPSAQPSGTRPADDTAPTPAPAHPVDYATFDRSSAVAWRRAADEDLRGAELELDELRATYDLDDRQSNQVWNFYGYIYTQYADYGRAIEAYEKAVAIRNFDLPGQWTSLASLYFARHQYDMALKTLLASKERSRSGRISDEATAMIERLRALGVTEETL